MYVQKLLHHWVFRPIGSITKGLHDHTRGLLVTICTFCIIALNLIFYSTILPIRYLYFYAPSCFFFGVIILLGITPNMPLLRFDKFALFCWLIVTIFIGVNSFLVTSDDLSEFLLWIFAFPLLFLTWGNKTDLLFKSVARGICWSFALYFLICMLFYPITGAKYAGFFANTNSAAMVLTAMCICMLIELIASEKLCHAIVHCLGIGASVSLVYYSNSRGGVIVLGISLVATIIIWILKESNKKACLIKVLGMVLSVAIMFFATVYISSTVFHLRQAVNSTATSQSNAQQVDPQVSTEHTTNSVETTTVPTTETTAAPTKETAAKTTMQDATETTTAATAKPSSQPSKEEKPNDIIANIESVQADRYNQNHSTLNAFTTGRVNLWKAYAKEVHWFGHGPDDVVYNQNDRVITKSSHWTQLQYAYQYGLLAGVFFLLLNCWSGLKVVWYVFKSKNRYRYFPFVTVLAFGAYSLIEANITTFGRPIVLLYFIALTPLIAKPIKDNTTYSC